ncbi:MAG: hypothetical protein AB1397_03330 [bacterium]
MVIVIKELLGVGSTQFLRLGSEIGNIYEAEDTTSLCGIIIVSSIT